MLATPAVPAISSTVASCSTAGSTNISNYLASNSYTFAPRRVLQLSRGIGIRNDDRYLLYGYFRKWKLYSGSSASLMQQCWQRPSSSNIFNSSKLFRCRINKYQQLPCV
jgi:hypothetical protein